MDIIQTPRVSGFNIELLSPNFTLNVQDMDGNLIDHAHITIDCDGETITGLTDQFGCFSAAVTPGEICTLTISSDCYQLFVQRFLLIPIDNTKNFVFKVVDGSDNPVVSADITITSTLPGSVTGQTDVDGMFTTDIDTNFSNTLTIQKSGFQDVMYTFNPFNPVSTVSEHNRIVPVITMQP